MNIINSFRDEHYFLSNFYSCKIVYESIEYKSTEHAYQAAKSLDISVRKRVAACATPGESKRLGQIIQIREDWDLVKNQVMYDVCKLKFSQSYFKIKLLATGDAFLEEGNTWHDNWFGVCYCGNCPEHKKQPKENQNNLGKILMKIRDSLQKEKIGNENLSNNK